METPLHITIALQKYDPNLDLKWDDGCKRWMVHYKGRALFAYLHTDGTPATRPFMLPGDTLAPLITILAPILTYPDAVVTALADDTSYVDHWEIGRAHV